MKSPFRRCDNKGLARRTAALGAAMALIASLTVGAQSPSQRIFKCVEGETIAYQSMPCERPTAAMGVLTISPAPDASPAPVAVPPVAREIPSVQSAGKMWPPRRTLMLGMSDDEVLNLAGWGVPQHIVRTKAAREWREEWIYPASTGERRLFFANAKLVDAIVDGDARQAMAQDQSARRSYPAS